MVSAPYLADDYAMVSRAIKTTPGQRIIGPDILRAGACLVVFASHLIQKTNYSGGRFFDTLREEGGLAVAIFFALSGFLLSLPFWKAFHDGKPMPSLRVYAVRRLGRILPGFYFCVLILAVFNQLYDSKWGLFSFFTTATFTNSYFRATYLPAWDKPLWSIGVEMHFYFMLPLFTLCMFRFSKARAVHLLALGLIAALVFGQQVFLAFAPAIEAAIADPTFFATDSWAVKRNPYILFTHFLFGVMAADAYLKLRAKHQDAPAEGKQQPGRVLNRYDLIVIVSVLVMMMVVYTGGRPLKPLNHMEMGWPLIPLIASILLVSLPFSKAVGPVLDIGFLRWTATLSYGIYIWHVPILNELVSIWPRRFHSGLDVILFGFVVLVATYAVAQFSYSVIERPVLNLVHRYRVPKPPHPLSQ